ncbi:hypothetical protein [Fictibacillus barbaricus]|nr:hypothetical protein [Fictibacillus barbaricus]
MEYLSYKNGSVPVISYSTNGCISLQEGEVHFFIELLIKRFD